MIKTTRNILACITLFCAITPGAQGQSSLTLPTPRDHYKTYNVETAELELIGKVIKDFEPQILKVVESLNSRTKTENLPPTESEELPMLGGDAGLELVAKVLNACDSETRKKVAEFLRSGAGAGDFPQMKSEDVIRLARTAGLVKYKADLLEILLHSSDVLAVVPKESFDAYGPIIHDSLLAFLDGLPNERIIDRAVALAMAHDASRGERILIFASKIPTLQKVGQIIARMDGIPPDIQQSLETLETGIHTMTRDELVTYVQKDVGAESLAKFDLQFDV